MNQVDAEMGYSKRSLLKQELSVVADDDIAGADLASHAVHSHVLAPHPCHLATCHINDEVIVPFMRLYIGHCISSEDLIYLQILVLLSHK